VRNGLLALLFVSLTAAAQTAQEGVDVRKSRWPMLPASMVERGAAQQYSQLMRAATQRRLLNNDAEQVERLRRIARELIPHSARFNKDAQKWRWEVNLISTKAVNAFCMPGGKIAVFSGILDALQLTDDEVAAVLGHEIAHALLEHGRARMTTEYAKIAGVTVAAIVLNLGNVSTEVLARAANLAVSLPYARAQETDADLVGLELAARAGHDPRAALSVWEKMQKYAQTAARGQPPQFLSTHPSHGTRIKQIEANLPKVLPLYRKAKERQPK
jgi:predicted Zn-dependent protease